MKKLIIIILICICAINVYATSNYYQMGTSSNNYNLADSLSLWNDANVDFEVADVDPVSNPNFMPIAGDLDSDGTQELIILSSNSISIKQVSDIQGNVNMNTIASLSLDSQTAGDYYSNIILNDIDNDGNLEIILHQQINAQIYIIGFNGTHAIEENKISFGNGGDADSQIGCNNQHCIIVFNTYNTQQSGVDVQAGFQSFNNDSMIDSPTNYYSQNGIDKQTRCFPKMENVIYANGLFYFVEGGEQIDDGQYLRSIETNSTGHIQDHDKVRFYDNPVPSSNCARGWDNFMPPTSVDFNEEFSNSEIFVTYQQDAETFKFKEYKSDLTFIDDYPELTTGEGLIISPPIGIKAFSQSQTGKDVCVVGYEAEEREIEILCASKTNPCFALGIDNVKFEYDMTNENFNITPDVIWTNLAHSIKSTQSTDMDEILTPYGVFELQDYCSASTVSFCKSLGVCDMDKIWTTPVVVESVHTALDLTNSGFQDIVALSEDNLYYIDDGFTNKQAYLEYCTKIEPDIDSIWKLHIEDTSVLNEGLFDSSFATSINIIDGTNEVGENFATLLKDGVTHDLDEDSGNINISINFTNPCVGLSQNKFTTYMVWNGTPADDYLKLQLWNYNFSIWDTHRVINPSTSFNWYNFTVNDFFNHGNSTHPLQLRIQDARVTPDVSDNTMRVDLFEIECFGYYETLASNSSNQVKITTKVKDPESQNVASRIYLYYGESNEQDTGWSNNVTSGEPIVFQNVLYPNESTSGSTLRIYYTDVESYGYADASYTDYTFIVQPTGDLYYESQSCAGLTGEEYSNSLLDNCSIDSDCADGESCNDGVCITIPSTCETSSECPSDFICQSSECVELPEDTQNIITDSAKGLSAVTKVPIGILILIFLGFLCYSIFKEDSIKQEHKLPATIILCLFAIGIFVKLGLLSVIWIILFILVIIGIIGIVAGRLLGGS